MEDNKSMEVFAKASIRKAVLQNALPAMAAMLMVLIYNLADTFFIGQTHDDLQVAAVSLATPVFLLFMSVGTVFGIGGTSVISRALGEGRRDYAKKVCSFCTWICVAVGVLMSALFLIFMDQILALIGASAETWNYAKTYLTIVSCSGPFVLIANCYFNVIRAEGQSGKAMMGQLLGNLLNVILDSIMILVFGWNIASAAIATVIGNIVGAGYYIVYFLKGSSSLSISLKDFSVKESFLRRSRYRCPCCFRESSDEPFQHHHEQSDGKVRRHGGSWCGRCHEGHNDDRHGLYRTWAERSVAARLLCRCEKLGAVQKRPQILTDICFFPQYRADVALLPLYRADRQRIPHGCGGV